MTATEAVPSTPTSVREPRAVANRVPLTRLTLVELRKMFDTRSGFWLITSIVIVSVLATTAVILFAPDSELSYTTFTSVIGFPVAVILPLIAILSVTSEWSQRTGLTTFTLVPHRARIIMAKAIASVAIGVASILLALAIGVLGNLVGSMITGTTAVWDASLIECFQFAAGNVLGMLIGFMLGVLIRSSSPAIVAYFIYAFLLPTIFGILAAGQEWFSNIQPWVDSQFAQAALFAFDGPLSGEQWANIAVTGVAWLVLPLVIGVRFVLKSEVK